MWVIGVEVEQETSATPPKKILDPPLHFVPKMPEVYPKLLRRCPEPHVLLLSLRCLVWVLIIPVLLL